MNYEEIYPGMKVLFAKVKEHSAASVSLRKSVGKVFTVKEVFTHCGEHVARVEEIGFLLYPEELEPVMEIGPISEQDFNSILNL